MRDVKFNDDIRAVIRRAAELQPQPADALAVLCCAFLEAARQAGLSDEVAGFAVTQMAARLPSAARVLN